MNTNGRCKDIFVCLECGAPLPVTASMQCAACGKEYATLADIPVLMKEPDAYLHEMTGLYASFILDKEEELSILEQKARHDTGRAAYYNSIITAIRENNQLIQTVLDILLQRIEPMELLKLKRIPIHNEVFKDFTYLKRDWCGLNTGEAQINPIISSLEQVIQQYIPDKSIALVLGSGLGRLAVSLCSRYECVLATDLSFSMLYFFERIIRQEQIDFYEVNYKNILKDVDAGSALTASMNAVEGMAEKFSPALAQNLCYFISDVLNLPLAPQSVSSIFSVYFTDVLSFRLMMSKVDKCLKPGGVFVHFGPLGYNFRDITEMLAGNEIRDLLINMGYVIVKEDIVETNHLDTDLSLQQTRFKNWLLVAQKQKVAPVKLKPQTKLIIAGNISYRIEGSLEPLSTDEKENIVLHVNNQPEIAVTPIVLEMLQYFCEEGSVAGLIRNLKESYDFDNDDLIMESLHDLLQKKILKVTTAKEQYAG